MTNYSEKNQLEKAKDFFEITTKTEKRKEFNKEIDQKTMYYQRKYGFKLNPDPKHRTWNVEADAFKHAFLSATLSFRFNHFLSNSSGIYHELENLTNQNPLQETNMDLWNNAIGRNIVKEIQKENGEKLKRLSQKQIEDIVAEKIIQKMKNGQLITHPSDKRTYTGLATNIENVFTPEEIGKMSSDEFLENESLIMEQLKQGLIQNNNDNFSDFKNPETGSSKIYSREDIATMTTDEFSKAEKEINAQMKTIGVPTNRELENSNGTVYVNPYTRDDGTEVKGYYRAKPGRI